VALAGPVQGTGRAWWDPQYLDGGGGEHCVERGAELRIPVPDEESEPVGAIAEMHQLVAGGLHHPVPSRDRHGPTRQRLASRRTAAS